MKRERKYKKRSTICKVCLRKNVAPVVDRQKKKEKEKEKERSNDKIVYDLMHIEYYYIPATSPVCASH